MSDRELLKLAAKAAGMTEHKWSDAWACLARWTNDKDGWYFEGPQWNPLTDDGDALRLAVKLRLRLHTDICFAEVPQDKQLEVTRRAIVRAAAEIGKAMP